jgi:hypothetical protein
MKRDNEKRRGKTKKRDIGQTKIPGRINYSITYKNHNDSVETAQYNTVEDMP